MPEEESSLLLIKNPPSRVTIQLEEESDRKKGEYGERDGRVRIEKPMEIAQGESGSEEWSGGRE